MIYLNEKGSDVLTASICIFVVCLALGLVFTRWPDRVQRYDMRMALYIKNTRTQKALIQGIGYFLLTLSLVALVASIVSFFH
jgi:hypothetical protein